MGKSDMDYLGLFTLMIPGHNPTTPLTVLYLIYKLTAKVESQIGLWSGPLDGDANDWK